MEILSFLQILVLSVGFYMAWNIGANDVSNAMGTSVGSGALTLRRAVILAAFLEFAGAFFAGSQVSETMQRGLIHSEIFADQPLVLILGMCAALLGTGLWLQIASYFGWPVSTTHAIVGAILGFAAVVGGVSALQGDEISSIALSWLISPILSAIISFLIFSWLQHRVLYALSPVEAARKILPYLCFVLFFTFTLSFLINGIDNLHIVFNWKQIVLLAIGIGALAFGICFLILRLGPAMARDYCPVPPSKDLPQAVVSIGKALKHLRRVQADAFHETHSKITKILQEVQDLSDSLHKEVSLPEKTSQYHTIEKMFGVLQILSACFVAFAHGANDVANAIGPVAAVLDLIKSGKINASVAVPSWLLAFGGVGIVIGLATWGWRVIETIGKKITELTPTRGFSAEFGAATTILIASKLGLPISTTHCLVGAVLGVGFARGMKAINLRMIRDIALSWIITLPASALSSIGIFYLLKAILKIV